MFFSLKGLPRIISNQWMVAWPLVNYFSRPQPQAIDDLQAAPSRWPDSILETTQWSFSSPGRKKHCLIFNKKCALRLFIVENFFIFISKYLEWPTIQEFPPQRRMATFSFVLGKFKQCWTTIHILCSQLTTFLTNRPANFGAALGGLILKVKGLKALSFFFTFSPPNSKLGS